MKFERPTRMALLLLAIPFLAMGVMIAREVYNNATHPEYRFNITGYDPRNLLTGHYIRFTYDWPEAVRNECGHQKICYVCVSGDRQNPTIDFAHDPKAANCKTAALLSTLPLTFNVSELEAPVLDKMLREGQAKFQAGLLIFPNHNTRIRNLYINGQPVADVFK